MSTLNVELASTKLPLGNVQTSGGTENGYASITFALINVKLDRDIANFILITDENQVFGFHPKPAMSHSGSLLGGKIPLPALAEASSQAIMLSSSRWRVLCSALSAKLNRQRCSVSLMASQPGASAADERLAITRKPNHRFI